MSRVLQITACAFPPEIRVLKEARTLRDAGHESAVLSPRIKGRPAREQWNGITIFRPQSLAGASAVADKVLYQSLFFSPAWWRALREVVREFRPDVLHVHDIWLARTALAVAGDARVVMDLHENMPAAVEEYLKAFRGAPRAFNWLFKRRPRVLRYEGRVLRRADLTLVVVKEAAERVLAEHPALPSERVVVVENLESREFLPPAFEESAVAADIPSLLYIGGFGPHRGIDTLIRAMTYLKEWGVRVRCDLVGAQAGSGYVERMRQLVVDLDVASHVNMVGWVPAEAVPGIIRHASIGVVPHHSNPHTDTTIPHKLYQYMISGRPVLVSSSAPLARTVRAARSGAVFRAGDAEDCARKVRELLSDAEKLRAMGESGWSYVVKDGHTWEDESAPVLLATYQQLTAAAAP